MEVVALPADRRPEAASAPDDEGRAGEVRTRPRMRATQRLEKAQVAAFMALRAVSSYSEMGAELPVFFARLSETIARLVRARRAAFWRLGPDRTLAVQPHPHGFASDSPLHELRIRLPVGGESITERVVFRDELDLVAGTSKDLDAFWHASGIGVRNSIAVSWRAGGRRIGALVAYDSRRGFSNDDVWVLRVAAMATGLMWQYREAEQELLMTVERLEQAAVARRQLLGNIAAGGDEARRRFASALHDDSLQLLTAAELQLERAGAEADPTKLAAQLDELKVTLKTVEDSLRRLLSNVSPQATDVPLGLDEAIRTRLDSLRTHTGIEPDIDLRLPNQIPDAIGSVVFKNLSEALTNVEKHAHATRINVSAHVADGGIRVVVADDGKGFVVAESIYMPGHLGLVTMRERAQLAGGRCWIESEPGAGARVEFWVPISH
ncbi:MAG: GAF domain-containing sensor histidine kinase [Candidatus Dormibacteraeota bacterium]|nr:GAF domain-containing sensor histidine kinase [Candidatus Dormibacteraeota bacterium]